MRVVRVSVTPVDDDVCNGKDAVAIAVTASGVKWRPVSPLCLSARYDAHTKLGRRQAADAAIDFFDEAVRAGGVELPDVEHE